MLEHYSTILDLLDQFSQTLRKHMQYLSSHQAMADYAQLLHAVKRDLQAEDAPVIGFGGSYGGMLAAWMRCDGETPLLSLCCLTHTILLVDNFLHMLNQV